MDNSEGRLQDFREYIERIFLQDPEIFAFDWAIKTCPPLVSFNYENLPEKDYITSITF